MVIVLDPYSIINISDIYIDFDKVEWQIFKYFGNDFQFRQNWQKQRDKDSLRQNSIIIVTKDNDSLDLAPIGDIIETADIIIDLTLTQVLKRLIPEEILSEDFIEEFYNEINNNLESFVKNLRRFHKDFKGLPLNKLHILLFIISSLGNIPIEEINLGGQDEITIIKNYLNLLFNYDLDNLRNYLDELFQEYKKTTIDLTDLMYFDKEQIAVLLYSIFILKRYSVSNIPDILNGWGIFPIDLSSLYKNISSSYSEIIKDLNLYEKIVDTAEDFCSEDTIFKITNSLNIKELVIFQNVILNEEIPGLIYGLCTKFIKELSMKDDKTKYDLNLFKKFSNAGTVKFNYETSYKPLAKALLELLEDYRFIINTLKSAEEKKIDLTSFIKNYKDKGYYLLQLKLANINNNLNVVKDENLRKEFRVFLDKKIKYKILEILEKQDLLLADLIEQDTQLYFKYPKLIINIFKKFIVEKRYSPGKDKNRVWILVLDGLRLDSWEQVVKPQIKKYFSIKEEELYLSLLPSKTDVSRVALIAGKIPSYWKDFRGNFTNNHLILAAINLGISEYNKEKFIQIFTGSETDIVHKKLDYEIKPYNILIFNLSDDWIHSERGDILQVNQVILSKLEKNIIPDLKNRISEGDLLIITSDHGFIELEEDKASEINDIKIDDSNIFYRYLLNFEYKNTLKINYGRENYNIAKGRIWFKKKIGRKSRYVHGGISLDEMIIPVAVLEKIMFQKIELDFYDIPEKYVLNEDILEEISIKVSNKGNTDCNFKIKGFLDSKEEYVSNEFIEQGKIKEIYITLKARNKTKKISFSIEYDNEKKKMIKKEITIRTNILEKKDKFEIDLSALDKFDNID